MRDKRLSNKVTKTDNFSDKNSIKAICNYPESPRKSCGKFSNMFGTLPALPDVLIKLQDSAPKGSDSVV